MINSINRVIRATFVHGLYTERRFVALNSIFVHRKSRASDATENRSPACCTSMSVVVLHRSCLPFGRYVFDPRFGKRCTKLPRWNLISASQWLTVRNSLPARFPSCGKGRVAVFDLPAIVPMYNRSPNAHTIL
jgi:hypothetical protein